MKSSYKSIKRINIFIGNGLKMNIYSLQKKKQKVRKSIENEVGNAERNKKKAKSRSHPVEHSECPVFTGEARFGLR